MTKLVADYHLEVSVENPGASLDKPCMGNRTKKKTRIAAILDWQDVSCVQIKLREILIFFPEKLIIIGRISSNIKKERQQEKLNQKIYSYPADNF